MPDFPGEHYAHAKAQADTECVAMDDVSSHTAGEGRSSPFDTSSYTADESRSSLFNTPSHHKQADVQGHRLASNSSVLPVQLSLSANPQLPNIQLPSERVLVPDTRRGFEVPPDCIPPIYIPRDLPNNMGYTLPPMSDKPNEYRELLGSADVLPGDHPHMEEYFRSYSWDSVYKSCCTNIPAPLTKPIEPQTVAAVPYSGWVDHFFHDPGLNTVQASNARHECKKMEEKMKGSGLTGRWIHRCGIPLDIGEHNSISCRRPNIDPDGEEEKRRIIEDTRFDIPCHLRLPLPVGGLLPWCPWVVHDDCRVDSNNQQVSLQQDAHMLEQHGFSQGLEQQQQEQAARGLMELGYHQPMAAEQYPQGMPSPPQQPQQYQYPAPGAQPDMWHPHVNYLGQSAESLMELGAQQPVAAEQHPHEMPYPPQ